MLGDLYGSFMSFGLGSNWGCIWGYIEMKSWFCIFRIFCAKVVDGFVEAKSGELHF
jgi:hypothetical protein